MKPVTKPSKQRKMVFQAPPHIRYKLFAAPLSSELQASQKVKTLPVRSGDTVRIMRGDHKGFEGKITSVDRKKYRIYVEGLTREKVDGTTIFVPIHPSKVMITRLSLDDKWRKKILERKRATREKIEEVVEKPPKKVAEVKEKVIEEKPPEKKPPRRKKKVAEKAKEEKTEEKTEKPEKKEKPKAKKPRAKRKTTEKTEGGK
ncbi:50S ribosomal protein L24 [Candidatus Bathyarchaeota archaeon A05DMB-5]|nr:50S ribosomal protein L24 [Candidatus Bathyarchaeota archaeon A05DMB-5]